MSKKVLGNIDKGLLFIISAPAGTGKSTIVNMLVKEFPDVITQSCSYTTRKARKGEIDKKHYHFVSKEIFEEKIKSRDFLEYASLFGHFYGTSKKEIEDLQKKGKHVVLVIDTQGAMQIKGKIPAIFIFISPPNMEELRRRLFKRQTESEEKIIERLEWAKKEIALIDEYDYHITNEDLNVTYQVIRSIFIAEEHKRGK